MKKKLTLLLTLSGLGAFSNAHALPTVYPEKTTLIHTMKNLTNSNIVADNVNPNLFYVMPPNSATSTVGGLHTVSANVAFCREMANTTIYTRDISAEMNRVQIQSLAKQKEVEKLQLQRSQAQVELGGIINSPGMEALNSVSDSLDSINLLIKVQINELNTCTKNCDELRKEIAAKKIERTNLLEERKALVAQYSKDARLYEQKKSIIQGYSDAIDSLFTVSQAYSDRLDALHNRFENLFAKYGAMEGARASITIGNQWEENVQTLIQNNPGFQFQKITTQKVALTSNIANLKNIPINSPILGYDLAGGFNAEDGAYHMNSYPENISGNIRLSLNGTCPMLHPDWFDPALPSVMTQMKYGITASYEYPSAFTYSVKMKYNMYKMYQKIISSGSSGGIFSSNSWSSVEEKNFFKDSFKVDWTSTDLVSNLSQEFKDKMENDMRNRILARLATASLPEMASRPDLLAPPSIPTTGAVVLANSLMQTCPQNIYCAGGAMALNVLQAIFGNSNTSSNYTNIKDLEANEEWSSTQVQYLPWVTASK
jgi:hypothetical protein